MIQISFQSLFRLLKKNLFHSSIRVWHLLIVLCLVPIVVILGCIPLYLKSNQHYHQIEYTNQFRIHWINGSPDGFQRPILTINHKYPCPIIIVNQGDLINITVINESNEETSIHWHGLHQRNTLQMDGVPGVTQCSIQPNENYLYQYSTDKQVGTYWYHSHSTIQYGDGLKGILIIKDPNDPWKSFYEDEDVIELTDWYHQPAHIHLQSYLYPGTLDPIPDNILFNGIGQFNCSFNSTCSFSRLSIKEKTRKRFRIINTSVYARITICFDEHSMRLIEIDGIYLDGNTFTPTLRLSPGQRYSVIIEAKNNSLSNYWISATIHPFVDYNQQYNYSSQTTVLAILNYNQSNGIPSIDLRHRNQMIINQSLLDGEIFSDQRDLSVMNLSEYSFPTKINRTKIFLFNSQHQGEQPGHFYVNNQTFIHPINETFLSMILHENSSNEIPSSAVFHIEKDLFIDLMINNIDFAPHPFHLHGHHFWILKQGLTNEGYLNQSSLYDVTNVLYRDTLTINAFSHAIIRFVTDNPGIWMMHCHNDWHLNLQMAWLFIESQQLIKEFYSNDSIRSSCEHH